LRGGQIKKKGTVPSKGDNQVNVLDGKKGEPKEFKKEAQKETHQNEHRKTWQASNTEKKTKNKKSQC